MNWGRGSRERSEDRQDYKLIQGNEVVKMGKISMYVYPAIMTPEDEGGYYIHFPDFENCYTYGNDILHGLVMAEDALALFLYTEYEEKGIEPPVRTEIKDIKLKADEFASYVICDTKRYRRRFGTKAVKKTLTIPEWLNDAAMEQKINFSKVLQEALMEKLEV